MNEKKTDDKWLHHEAIPKHFPLFDSDSSPDATCKVELCRDKRRIDTLHWHNYYQIWYTLRGSYKQTIDGVEYHMNPGSIAVIPPFSIHSNDMLEDENLEIICVDFLVNSLSELWNVNGMSALIGHKSAGFYFLGEKIRTVAEFDEQFKVFADEIFSELLNCYQEHKNVPVSLFIKSLFAIFCAMPPDDGESLSRKQLASLNDQLCTMERTTEYMHENYYLPLTISDMLPIACMSKTPFCSVFKKITGFTFSEYLSRIRCGISGRFLTISEQTLPELAGMTCFANASHLVRAFHKYMHQTPSEYREHSREWFLKYAPQWLPDDLKEK